MPGIHRLKSYDELSANSGQVFKTAVYERQLINGVSELVQIPAANFSKAEYSIINPLGYTVFYGDLNNIITIEGDDFITKIDHDMLPFSGNGFRHQFIVYNQAGESFTPVFNRDLRINKVSKL